MSTRHHDSFVFEVTQLCNHTCSHCYNVWNNPKYPYAVGPGQLGTADTTAMLGKLLDETSASLITLTGGEPLLRTDIYQIVDYLVSRQKAVNLITNGVLLTADVIGRLGPDKVSVFELPLLSVERDIHDRMSGNQGAFDKVTMAVAQLKAAGQRVVCVFVATRLNLPTFRQTAELAIALGADAMMFNRFNPGGRGVAHIEELQATPAELAVALDAAQELSERYQFPISCSIAMPPCLFDTSRWPKLGFGFCAAGTERAYYTLDPVGNIRPCNHSPTILGNIRTQNFWDIADSRPMKDFMEAVPPFCAGCKVEKTCQGGCKASAEVCGGSVWKCDPFLEAFSSQAHKLAVGD